MTVLYNDFSLFEEESYIESFHWLFERVFRGGIDSFIKYVDYFGQVEKHPEPYSNFGNIAAITYRYFYGDLIRGNMNAAFIGELFAYWGENLLGFFMMVTAVVSAFFALDFVLYKNVKTYFQKASYAFFASYAILPTLTNLDVWFWKITYSILLAYGLVMIISMLRNRNFKIVETNSPIFFMFSSLVTLIMLRSFLSVVL